MTNSTMDPDIIVPTLPIVPATYVSNVPVRPATTKGRSSRVALSREKSYTLTKQDVKILQEQGFTAGLAKAMTRNNVAFPLRIWVVDNSGSMNLTDGHRLVETPNNSQVKIVGCTRWAEIQQTVEYHAQVASVLRAPTVFRLLNDPGRAAGPQQFSVAQSSFGNTLKEVVTARSVMRSTHPTGVTPLSVHVREIRDNVMSMLDQLNEIGGKVAVILATDGLPTDGRGICDSYTRNDFVESLRSLEGLPVWVVIRLCTDKDDVVKFYNSLDQQLELSLEVLDDFVEEAQEVYEHNNWLNYALPLHRCREMGYHDRLFDLLDERKLTADELRDFLCLLFGEDRFDAAPDPQGDWKGFLEVVSEVVKGERQQWNPIKKKLTPWINLKKLAKAYGARSCVIM